MIYYNLPGYGVKPGAHGQESWTIKIAKNLAFVSFKHVPTF